MQADYVSIRMQKEKFAIATGKKESVTREVITSSCAGAFLRKI